MSSKFVPHHIFDSIYDITPEWLAGKGIRGLLLDLDNTLARPEDPRPPEKTVRWLEGLTEAGLSFILLSNNKRERVRDFCEGYPWRYIGRAKKPLRGSYLRAAAMMGLGPREVAVVGDQIFTDTFGARRSGMLALMVRPMRMGGRLHALRCALERPFVRRALNKGEGGLC